MWACSISASFADLSCTVLSGDLAEVGGLVGLNNRGLVANSYAVCSVYGSGSRENGNEGMAVVSALVACNAGTVVNCYGSGDTTTKEYSTYVGMASGWVTGIGKTYLCWYDLDSTMLIGKDTSTPQLVRPVESIGTKVSSGVNDEGDQYTGGLVDRMTGYDAAGYAAIAAALNANFAAFPADITVYGLSADALRTWTYDADRKLVVPGADAASVTYVQPACEKVNTKACSPKSTRSTRASAPPLSISRTRTRRSRSAERRVRPRNPSAKTASRAAEQPPSWSRRLFSCSILRRRSSAL